MLTFVEWMITTSYVVFQTKIHTYTFIHPSICQTFLIPFEVMELLKVGYTLDGLPVYYRATQDSSTPSLKAVPLSFLLERLFYCGNTWLFCLTSKSLLLTTRNLRDINWHTKTGMDREAHLTKLQTQSSLHGLQDLIIVLK